MVIKIIKDYVYRREDDLITITCTPPQHTPPEAGIMALVRDKSLYNAQFPPLPSNHQQPDKPTIDTSKALNFGKILTPKHLTNSSTNIDLIPRKHVQYVEGVPTVQWTEEEVRRMA
ncbi:hypothetical protein HAX54_043327 [Datura stramonium]|uniref:Uncharacterized protein n=1 Tax=Datura stramonium TaxID=4076 RepID=A0ABS8W2H1_DATST|nr:hypothetical protein [Datura stramonium]